jgi:hypothetical protein
MVFMVPRLREQPTEGDLEAWAKAVATFRADMKAYDLRTPALRSSTNGRFFPGVILLARIVRAPHR